MVLSTRTARRHVTVDAIAARFPPLSRSPRWARGTPPTGGAGILPLVIASVSCFLLGLGLQTSGLHSSGNAAVGLGVGLLFESARAARPAGSRQGDTFAVALAFTLGRSGNSSGVGAVYCLARACWIQTAA